MIEPLILHQRIKLPYRYTAGPIHEAVLRGFEDHKVLGGSCGECGHVAAPAKPFCPGCSSAVHDLAEVADVGTLLSWTAVDGNEGVRFALVRLDGSDGAMLHRFVSDDPCTHGMRVRIEWASDSIADITAIAAFVPA